MRCAAMKDDNKHCLRSDLRRLRAGFGIPVCDDSMGVKDTYSRPLKD